MTDEEKKIITDDDWKEQARKEKEKLTDDKKEPASGAAAGAGGARGPMPPANVLTLINTLVVQAMFYMGKLSDPDKGETQVDLDMAKHHVDMLGVIEEKTKGNLTDKEDKALSVALHEVRMLYVQCCS